MLRLATRTRVTAGPSTSAAPVELRRPSCPCCTSRALRTLRRGRDPPTAEPLDDWYWRKSERIFDVARLNTRAADDAHRSYYQARRTGTSGKDEDYERHLTRWNNWRAPPAIPRRMGPKTPRSRRHSHRATRSLHTARSSTEPAAHDRDHAHLGPGDFVELRLGGDQPEYGYLLGTAPEQDKLRDSGPLNKRISQQTQVSDILDTTRFYFLNCQGTVSLESRKDITFRYALAQLSPAFAADAAEAISRSALLPEETRALGASAGSGGLVPGRPLQRLDGDDARGLADQQEVYKNRMRVCSHMNRFLRQVEIQLSDYRSRLFHLMSMLVRFEDRYVHLTTAQVATMLEHKTCLAPEELDTAVTATPPSAVSLLATHQLLMFQHDWFICDENAHVDSSIWTLRPQRERNALNTVQSWLDDVAWLAQPPASPTASPIYSFIETATQAIRSGGKVTWSDDDKIILSVLLDCFASSRMLQRDIYRHVVFTLLKAFNHVLPQIPGHCDAVYYNRFRDDDWKKEQGLQSNSNDTLLTFVKSLKLFPEHITDWTLLAGRAKRVLEPALLERQKILAAAAAGALPSPPSEDLDAHIRTPFHDDVFVIDDPTARELDDGLSVSEPSGPDGKMWVHVHVADPTCTLTPDETIAEAARRQSASLYFRDGALPLLAGRPFPGVADKESSGPAKVLTFSALIDDQGLCHDVSIMPRTVTKQHIMSYDEVSEIIADEQSTHPHARKLHALARVGKFLSRRRAKDGGFVASSNTLAVELKPSPQNKGGLTPSGGLPFYLPSPLVLSDPSLMGLINEGNYIPPLFGATEHTVDLSHRVSSWETHGGQDLVAELMIMAGRVAAAWGTRAVDSLQSAAQPLSLQKAGDPNSQLDVTPMTWSTHPLALPYRTQAFPLQLHDRWTRELRKLCGETGKVEWMQLLEKGILPDAGSLQAAPGQHMSMGIGSSAAGIYDASRGGLRTRTGRRAAKPRDLFDGCGYVRMTSPLRRYNDLLAHWQVKAILHRAFPRTVRGDVALQEAIDKRKSTLMTQGELENAVQSLAYGDRMIKSMDNNTTKHWALKAIRLELERAGLHKSNVPDPLPGRPGKNWHIPNDAVSPAEQAPSEGGLILANPPDSPLSQFITSSAVPAFVTDPLMRPDGDSGSHFVKIRIPSLGIGASYPVTPFTSPSTLEQVKRLYTYVPPRPDCPTQMKAGGAYVGSAQLEGVGETFVNNELRVGKPFNVSLRFVGEEVAGATVLAGSPRDVTGDAKAQRIPGTYTAGKSITGVTV